MIILHTSIDIFFISKFNNLNTYNYHFMLQVISPITIGFIQFKENISKSQIEELISQRPLSLLIQDQDWDITANRYRQLINDHTFQTIEVLYITSLKIRWNEARNILRSIQNIAFPHLRQLYLNGNSIESIEGLTVAQFTYLTVLNFKENNINCLKSLRKCSFPQLQELMLYKNKVIDFMPIFQMHAPKLHTIWTTPQCQSFDNNSPLTWVFKLPSKKIKSMFVKHERGQPFNFSTWREMAKRAYPGSKLIYRIKDDIGVRLE